MDSLAALPTLPDLPGDAILDVYTHSSLGGPGVTDNSRYSIVGETQCKASIAVMLFFVHPPLSQAEIVERQQIWLNDGFIHNCVKAYKLDTKLRVLPSCRDEILGSTVEMRKVFFAYMGGIVIHKGFTAFHNYMQSLIHTIDSNMPIVATGAPNGTPASTLTNHPVKSEPIEGSFDSSNATASSTQAQGKNNVQMLHELGQQRKFRVVYELASSGQAHQLTWSVRIKVDGIEKATATSSDKRSAKEIAAGDALRALGM